MRALLLCAVLLAGCASGPRTIEDGPKVEPPWGLTEYCWRNPADPVCKEL